MRWLPNFLTALRIFLTPWIVLALLDQNCGRALWLSALAGISDGLDGFLARRFRWVSRTGAYLDPVADKLLLTSLYLTFGSTGIVPALVVWLIVGRDVLILAMAAAGFLFTTIREFPPSVWGKISTLFQIGTAVILLSGCAGWSPAQKVQQVAIGAVIVATLWSGAHYLWLGICSWRHLRQDEH